MAKHAGQFKKGQSGNPSGRPKDDLKLRELARKHTREAVETLIEVMSDKDTPPAARVNAAIAILDRGYGRPGQSVDMTSSDGSLASAWASAAAAIEKEIESRE
jgi:hypothetical protein